MSSRDKILTAVRNNQPNGYPLPPLISNDHQTSDLVQKFIRTLGNIGGTAIEASNWGEIALYLTENFSGPKRWVNLIPELENMSTASDFEKDPHLLENVSLSILKGHFGVAENGAVWITDACMGDRALPFICEHLVLVVDANNILSTMHDAYDHIGTSDYNFGTFIAGPSKTADIEQSLVLGAHGPKSLTLFLLQELSR